MRGGGCMHGCEADVAHCPAGCPPFFCDDHTTALEDSRPPESVWGQCSKLSESGDHPESQRFVFAVLWVLAATAAHRHLDHWPCSAGCRKLDLGQDAPVGCMLLIAALCACQQSEEHPNQRMAREVLRMHALRCAHKPPSQSGPP